MIIINNTGECITRWIRWFARIWSFPIIAYFLIMLAGYTWNWVTIGKADPYAVEGYPFVEVLLPNIYVSKCTGIRHRLALREIERSDYSCF